MQKQDVIPYCSMLHLVGHANTLAFADVKELPADYLQLLSWGS